MSRHFMVELPIPDAEHWSVDDHSDRWLVAQHAPSKSMLWVREWHEGSVVTHAQCEAEARLLRPDLLGRDESALVDRRVLGAPPDFDTEVGFSVRRAKSALGGVAVAIGANLRTCLVMAYATRADGPNAPAIIGQRLALVAERVFGRAATRTIEDRVAPEESR